MENTATSTNNNNTANAAAAAAAHSGLTPSQAMKGKITEKKPSQPNNNSNSNSNSNNNGENGQQPSEQKPQGKGNRKRNNRRRKQNKQPNGNTADGVEANQPPSSEDASTPGQPTANNNKSNNRKRGKGKGKQQPQQQQQQQQQNGDTAANKPQGKKGRNRKPRKRYPWRRFIPDGTVDPITLENLNSLSYPPFALVQSEPYIPVPIWPVPEGTDNTPEEKTEDIEELNRRRLQEQWGNNVVASDEQNDATKPSGSSDDVTNSKRYYNLFDGRALAYYLVSQLQFIDPLNRRDLTRDELLNLDNYLRRHGFKDLRVTEAYDAKGITLSSAGAAASTAQGRADIMQQMARNLLNALFGGSSVEAANQTPPPAPSGRTALQEQYEAMRLQEEQARASQQQPQQRGLNPDATPFGSGFGSSHDGGMMVIDDDENPGLRGGNYSATPGSVRSNAFYSAAHIAGRYGTGTIPATPDAFPSLPTPSAPAAAAPRPQKEAVASAKPAGKPSKTLARIAGAVKKTNPEEQQRQWEARELARKKAMLSGLTFGVDAAAPQAVASLPRPPPVAGTAQVGEGMLQRNMALADALGVQPATVRQQINSGWSRPTDGSSLGIDEFGNELLATVYPDALIVEAKERMFLVQKLEKKWKNFLLDDTAASVPLNSMDRPARAFVHHYSDFWNLRTESFDPEPRRYIHCVKMLDTHMPRPLLSEVARSWRGPTLQLPTAPKASDHVSHQAAGQTTKSREAPPPGREPLALAPRSLPVDDTTKLPLEGEGATSRFGALADERERPKLELTKRSLPLEMPEFKPEPTYNLAEDMKQSQARKEEKERKRREAEELKRRTLELAFASDSEEESLAAADSGSEWEESEPLFDGSDEE